LNNQSSADGEDDFLVLVVEDEPELREVVCAVLEDEGYIVVSAKDGRQAVDMACATPPSLILLDMGLPILSGEEVAAALQERLDQVPPILVMSAAGTVAERARRVGAASYIAKPFDLDDLTEAVQSVLGTHSR
jgi:DNA-binding response OmpR family regulator